MLLSGLFLSACSAKVAVPPAPMVAEEMTTAEKGGARRQAVTMHATVEKIDHKSRRVTLLAFDGTRETIVVGEEAKNLAQVRKGDEVIVTYYQSIAFEVLEPGDDREQASESVGLAEAKLGEMPGGLAAHLRTVVVQVVKLDPDNSTAVLRGPDGETTTVDVVNPAAFDKVKVGDKVEIRLTEAIGIDVQPATK